MNLLLFVILVNLGLCVIMGITGAIGTVSPSIGGILGCISCISITIFLWYKIAQHNTIENIC